MYFITKYLGYKYLDRYSLYTDIKYAGSTILTNEYTVISNVCQDTENLHHLRIFPCAPSVKYPSRNTDFISILIGYFCLFRTLQI